MRPRFTNGDAEITWTMPARRIHDESARPLALSRRRYFMADCGKGSR